MMVTSIFSCFHNIFYPIIERKHHHTLAKRTFSGGIQKNQPICLSVYLSLYKIPEIFVLQPPPTVLLQLYKPFPKRQILDFSKLKEFTDDKFEFDENGRQFYKQVENTVGKGEIGHNEQFLLFPLCF